MISKKKVVANFFGRDVQPRMVRRKMRIREDAYDICPHCGVEIGEKGTFFDGRRWYHRRCGLPIYFPEPDYTKYDTTFLSPEQLIIKDRQLKESEPKGDFFYFRIRTYGKKLPEFLECHPKCEYLDPDKHSRCNLFKRDLKKNPTGRFKRTPECISAVEGLMC